MKSMMSAAALIGSIVASGNANAQNAEAGEALFKVCKACHQVGEGAKNAVGPMLNGIVGRKVGTIEGFNYSEANKEVGAKGVIWTEDELFKYLEKPLTYMPKTKMAYAGMKDAQDRKDLIAFLKAQTGK